MARSTKQEQGDNDICGVRLPARLAVVTGLGSQAYSGAAKLWKKDLSAPAEGRQKLQKVLVEGKVVRAMFENLGQEGSPPSMATSASWMSALRQTRQQAFSKRTPQQV